MGSDYYRAEPLWAATETWKTANRTLEYLIRRHGPNLIRAVGLARDIQVRLEWIFLLLDDLCTVTCPWCPDPCCLTAKVWMDFKDLLFLHLNGHRLPPAVLRGHLDRYSEQLSLTLFAKAQEVTLFSYSHLIEMTRRDDETMEPMTQVARVAGYVFDRVDAFLGELGEPLGVKTYKPYHSRGEDFLPNYVGMLGIPMEITPEFPTKT